MPKIKTNRGAAKRFKKTKTGYKRRKAFRNHILSKVAAKVKRLARRNPLVHKNDVAAVRQMLGE